MIREWFFNEFLKKIYSFNLFDDNIYTVSSWISILWRSYRCILPSPCFHLATWCCCCSCWYTWLSVELRGGVRPTYQSSSGPSIQRTQCCIFCCARQTFNQTLKYILVYQLPLPRNDIHFHLYLFYYFINSILPIINIIFKVFLFLFLLKLFQVMNFGLKRKF